MNECPYSERKRMFEQVETEKPLKTRFHVLRFLKFLIYHILFFTLGPIAALPVLIIDGRILVHNMGFVGCNFNFFNQMIPTFCAQSGVILWFTLSKGTVGWIEIVSLEFVIFLRALVIAIKYGFLLSEDITKLK